MPIIIPSKSIYEMDNPKVIENALKQIDITEQNVQFVVTSDKTDNLKDTLTLQSLGITTSTGDSAYTLINKSLPLQVWGTWLFNSTITLPSSQIDADISFEADSNDFTKLIVNDYGITYESTTLGISAYVASGNNWTNDNLKRITFSEVQTVDQDFYDWLEQNATWQLMILGGHRIDSQSSKAEISLERLREDYYITEINPTIEVDFNVKTTKLKATSVWGDIPTFEYYTDDEYTPSESHARNYVLDERETIYDGHKNIKLESALSVLPDKIISSFSMLSDKNLIQNFDITTIPSNINTFYPYKTKVTYTNDNINIIVNLVSKITIWVAINYTETSTRGNFGNPTEAIKIELEAKEARIIYNETIRYLSSKDNNLSLTINNPQGEEVFSVDSNPFIRTGNLYNGENATSYLFNETLNEYSKGKEIATIRCSIGEYYDENGNKVISTDKDSSKMLFEHYDEVVPMVSNSWGTDSAMSYGTETNYAKTFEVVGVKAIFDGAVWQELTLRELGTTYIRTKLPKPIITIEGTILNIYDKSGEATSYDVYMNGAFSLTLTETSVDLNSLILKGGVYYTIYVISKSNDYDDSDRSTAIKFRAPFFTTYYVEENASGGLTYYISSNDYLENNGTFNIGGVL